MVTQANLIATTQQDRAWRALKISNAYRICLAVILALMYYYNDDLIHPAWVNVYLFFGSCVFYIIYSLFAATLAYLRISTVFSHVFINTFVDITVFALMIYTSQDALLGFGILMGAAIAAASILIVGMTSLIYAAYSSIAIFSVHFLENLLGYSGGITFSQVILFSLTFFATASFVYMLSKRILNSETLALEGQEEVNRLQALNTHIIQYMRSGVIVVDEHLKLRLMNRAASSLLCVPADKTPKVLADLSTTLQQQLEAWLVDPSDTYSQAYPFKAGLNGPEVIAQFTSLPQEEGKGYAIFFENTMRMAQQAQQLKLVSLGGLTASIAHEVRNPLGAISHASQLLEESAEINTADLRLVQIIREHSEKTNDIINNVLQLSRGKQSLAEAIELNTWVESFCVNYCLTHEVDATAEYQLSDQDLSVFVDKSQLQQIVTNLVENAIYYSDQHAHTPFTKINLYRDATTQFPILEVLDSGAGIAADVLPHIFEPFFTTGRSGNGLGLYITKELCDANQIKIEYQDREQGGGCFKLNFQASVNVEAG